MDELFAKDPIQLTDEEKDRIIEEYRAKRHLFAQEESAAKAAGRKINPKYADKKPKKEPLTNVNIADLELEI